MSPEEDHASGRAVFFTHEFKRNIRQLARRYRQLQMDIQPVLTALEAGATPGDRITGVSVEVDKVRAVNSDRARGKSGGYRIIYQITAENTVVLITIYTIPAIMTTSSKSPEPRWKAHQDSRQQYS